MHEYRVQEADGVLDGVLRHGIPLGSMDMDRGQGSSAMDAPLGSRVECVTYLVYERLLSMDVIHEMIVAFVDLNSHFLPLLYLQAYRICRDFNGICF